MTETTTLSDGTTVVIDSGGVELVSNGDSIEIGLDASGELAEWLGYSRTAELDRLEAVNAAFQRVIAERYAGALEPEWDTMLRDEIAATLAADVEVDNVLAWRTESGETGAGLVVDEFDSTASKPWGRQRTIRYTVHTGYDGTVTLGATEEFEPSGRDYPGSHTIADVGLQTDGGMVGLDALEVVSDV